MTIPFPGPGDAPEAGGSAHTPDTLVAHLKEKGAAGLSLAGAHLVDQDLTGVDLSGVDLSGADLSRAGLQGVCLAGANLAGATLYRTRLDEAELLGVDLTGANLQECSAPRASFGHANLAEANLMGATLEEATLTGANLKGADLRLANLSNARMRECDLSHALLNQCELSGADLGGSNVDHAAFDEAHLCQTRLADLRGFQTSHWIAVRFEQMDFVGAHLLRRHIMDQNYLHEFRRQSRVSEWVYRLWWVTSDCGRSFLRWGMWTLLIAVVFAYVYTQVDVDFGPHKTALSPLYYSVVTLTTLGYGDALPTSLAAQVAAMVEVLLGYIMLGGLLAIFATRMARRSE
jgi:uncharacterized protein YjbI with pentapeptide repeats